MLKKTTAVVAFLLLCLLLVLDFRVRMQAERHRREVRAAVYNDDVDRLRSLILERGFHKFENQEFLIEIAALDRQYLTLRYLLENHYDPEEADPDRYSILSFAIGRDQDAEIVQMLIDFGMGQVTLEHAE